MKEKKNYGALAFLPFILLIGLVLGNVVVNMALGRAQSENGISILAVTLIATVFSFTFGNGTTNDRVDAFSRAAADPSTLMMVMIFLLAGTFTSVSRSMGAVDSLVNLCLSFLPKSMIYAGIMIVSGLIALSIGTSVGTVTAMAPIAAGLVKQSGLDINIALAACVAGAIFGDNLSMISDTTIAATRGLGCEMKDKFKMNFLMVLPAVIITLIIYTVLGSSSSAVSLEVGAYTLPKIIPYIFVIVAALCGMNVMTVLLFGIGISAGLGFIYGDFTFISLMNAMGDGMSSMKTVIITSLLVKGMMGVIDMNGGISWLIKKLTGNVKSAKGAQYSIAALSAFLSVLLRSTSAIIVAAPLAKDINDQYDLDPRRTASILDIFATLPNGFVFWEGLNLVASQLVPEGDTLIMAGHAFYSMVILVVVFLTIQLGINTKLGKKKAAS